MVEGVYYLKDICHIRWGLFQVFSPNEAEYSTETINSGAVISRYSTKTNIN